MKLTLLESQPRRTWMREGVLASVGVHALIISVSVAATRPPTVAEDVPVSESVRFLVPMDRILGVKSDRPRAQRVHWAREGEGAGNDGELARKVVKHAPRPAETVGEGPDEGAPTEPTPPPVIADSVLTVLEVDSAVTRYPDSAAPAFPATMLTQNIEGSVSAQFVVDTLGYVDLMSFRVLDSTHPDFANAVRVALPGMRFRPAIAASHKVRQLVQQMFSFKILTPEPVETAKLPGKKPEH